jgi:PTS system nitrogen regulatory IIA component
MNLTALLSKDCTKRAVLFNSKKRILEYIAELAHHSVPSLDESIIFEALMAREKLGTTGIGAGIAIPHGKVAGISEPVVIFVVTKDAIQFNAIDNQAVDIFCATLIPENQCQMHLSTLASIARLLSQKDLTRSIRQLAREDESVASDADLYSLLLRYSEQAGIK